MLKSNNVKYIDNRAKKGCLWIIGGSELVIVVKKAQKLGYYFRFKKDGGRATKYKSAWWCAKK